MAELVTNLGIQSSSKALTLHCSTMLPLHTDEDDFRNSNVEDGLKKAVLEVRKGEGIQINARFLLSWVQVGFTGHLATMNTS